MKKFVSVAFVLMMVISCLHLTSFSAEAASSRAIIEMTGDPDATFRDIAWQKDGQYAVAVGNDSSNNGVIYHYDPYYDSWNSLATTAGVRHNGVAQTDPYLWIDWMEGGINGWTTQIWNGTLNWHQVDPSTLPIPGSGQPHGVANSGSTIWWLGDNATGNYVDGVNVVTGSLYSPPVILPSISTMGAIVFEHWFDIEAGGGMYDRMTVSIRNVSGGNWYELKRWNSQWVFDNGQLLDWEQEIIDLTGWLGNYIQLNFTFNTLDATANDFGGWHIDDVVLYTNDVFIAVGEPGGGGFSAYTVDAYTNFKNVGGMNLYDFNDVAKGPRGADFVAIGDGGAVQYWNNSAWHTITGAASNEVLTGIDSNATHFFIVGYDSTGHGVAYYYPIDDFNKGRTVLHPMIGAPDYEFNDVKWSDTYPTQRGYGLGAIAAKGTIMSFSDPEVWRVERLAGNPSARLGHALVSDRANNGIIMFGGNSGASYLNDTWFYVSPTKTWFNISSTVAPSKRYGHSMVFDTDLQRAVLFGGSNGGQKMGDTWMLFAANNTWVNISMPGPSPRYRHSMVYDEYNSRIILFGGDSSGSPNGETWAHSGGVWTNLTPGLGLSPPARMAHSMAYDRSQDSIVLFGGQSGGYLNDTWLFDVRSDTWTNVTPVVSPPVRFRQSMIYDEGARKLALFGGANISGTLRDTWTYDTLSNEWVNLYPARRPLARRDHAMVYDKTDNVPKMFGGTGALLYGDLWQLNILPAWNGDVVSPAKYTNGENFTALAWDNTGRNGIFVGNNGTGGVAYSFHFGTDYIKIYPKLGNILEGHELYGVAYRPKRTLADAILVGGSAFRARPYMIDQSTQLYVNTEYPNIFDIDFREQATSISRLNQEVDVNSNYTFYIEGNYTIGNVDRWTDVAINITAWFDEGKTGAASSPEGSWVTEDNRTRQFSVTYTAGTGNTLMNYPVGSPGTDEFIWVNTWQDSNIYFGLAHRVYINISFQAQTWAADGDTFANGSATLGRIWDNNSAWNDPNSWDFAIKLYDTNNPSAYNESYEEFGIKEAVSISASGNPSGNAPPGSTDVPLSPQSTIIYSSNTPYWVNVSIPDLLLNGIGPANIPATSIAVQNTHTNSSSYYSDINSSWPVGRQFLGATLEYCVWGNTTTNIFLSAPKNGTQAAGVWGSDFTQIIAPGSEVTQINWWATVPGGSPEGVYWATITFSIKDT